MTDETPSSGRDSEGPVAGQRLAAARKSRDISIFEIAKELHLDEHKVQALEENRFDTLGAPVFAKGHLRKYAQLVGVDIDDVMADYYALNRAVGAPPVVGVARKPARELPSGPWLLVGALLVVVAAAYLLWPSRSGDDTAPADEAPVDERAVEEAAAADEDRTPAGRDAAPVEDRPPQIEAPEDDSAPAAEATPQPASEPPADVEEPAVTAAPAAARPAEPADGEVTLSMTFTGDCWTEVSDATGARLFFDLGRAGRTVSVSGEPPLRVLFGDGDNVELSVNGAERRILASERRGRTARFTVTGQ